MNSPLWSSIAFINVAIASCPKSYLEPYAKEYASSINNTPPIALSITSAVFSAVWPIYPATKSFLSTSINLFSCKTPALYSIFAIILAIVVFPVPGFPVNIICKFVFSNLSPSDSAFTLNSINFSNSLTFSFTVSNPTIFCKASSTVSFLYIFSGKTASFLELLYIARYDASCLFENGIKFLFMLIYSKNCFLYSLSLFFILLKISFSKLLKYNSNVSSKSNSWNLNL